MISKNRQSVFLFALKLKAALILATPALAWAADATVQHVARTGSIETVTSLQWAFIVGFAMLGWSVSELDKIAELWNLDGKTNYEKAKERLKLLKGVAASNAAGIVLYFLSQSAPSFLLRMIGVAEASPGSVVSAMPEMVAFVFVAAGGYLGARVFTWFERKLGREGS